MDYLACEQRVFHLDMHQALWNMYSPDAGNAKDLQLRRMADKLVTVFATLDQDPVVRYASGHHLTNHLANLVREKLDAFRKLVPTFGAGGEAKKPRPILLVLERSYDMVSPFLHELTYQAMCQDLLPIENDVYHFETDAGKREVLLNENDILWPTLRHKHIADTSSHLIQSFRQFVASNAAIKFKSGDVNTLQDMSKVLRAMPEFQELREKYALHISLANQCIHEFGAQSLEQICYLEQALATGTDKEYKAVKSSEVARDMTNAVKRADVSLDNKLRMLLLYIVTQTGLKADNIASLAATAGLGPAETKALDSLKHFGFDVAKPRDKKKKSVLEMLNLGGKPVERAQYELSRYVPPLKNVLSELAGNTLDKEQFPYLLAGEEIKDKTVSKKPASLVPTAWGEGGNNNNSGPGDKASAGGAETRDVIVFVIGGLSYSECRVAYEAAAESGRNIFVGSTSVYQPKEFVRQLQHLANPHPPPVLRIERLGNKVQSHG